MHIAVICKYLQVSALDFCEWSAACYSQTLGQREFSQCGNQHESASLALHWCSESIGQLLTDL